MKSDSLYQFKNIKLQEQAFTHRSYLNEHKNKSLISNERLEFLGDAVLELIVSIYLYSKFGDYDEGKLTSLRSKLVQTTTLSLAALKLKFNQKIKLSKGEKALGGDNNPSILADTFEAFVGAVYQDGGLEAAYQFIDNFLLKPAQKSFAQHIPQDYKSRLQEIVQAKGSLSPSYKVISSFGPDHNKTFKTAVIVDNKILAQGEGKSKQAAEQATAKLALANLHIKK